MEKKLTFKLHNIVQKYNISIRELSRLTDIPRSTLSKLMNQKIQNIHIPHLLRIADVFGINDIREIIDLEYLIFNGAAFILTVQLSIAAPLSWRMGTNQFKRI